MQTLPVSHILYRRGCLEKMDLREILWGGMDWIDLAQNKDRWRDLVNTEINRRFYKMFGNS
jgi:hypothetical protein